MEHLIESVRRRPCLWKVDSPDYKDNELKEAAWLEVYQECDFPNVAETKTLWKKLRDGYRQAVNSKKKTTGQAADSPYKWRYEHLMEFLLPHMKNRTTCTNIRTQQQFSHSEENVTGDESLDQDVQDSSSEIKKKKPKNVISLLEEERKQREKRIEERDILKRKIVEKALNKPNETTALEKFFQCMCATTSQLPEQLQVRIQRQIFNIIMDAKEQHLMSSPTEYTTQYSTAPTYISSSEGSPSPISPVRPAAQYSPRPSTSSNFPKFQYSPNILQSPSPPIILQNLPPSQNISQYSPRPKSLSCTYRPIITQSPTATDNSLQTANTAMTQSVQNSLQTASNVITHSPQDFIIQYSPLPNSAASTHTLPQQSDNFAPETHSSIDVRAFINNFQL